MNTGLKDKHGKEIQSGNFVSLAGNITADDSMGSLPNGWFFDEGDVFEVYFDERIKNWSLKLNCEPDSPLNIKYMNHALSLLHDERIEIVGGSEEKKLWESLRKR